MTNKRRTWPATLTAFLAAILVSRVALAVNEVEPNDPIDSAQKIVLDSDGTLTINGGILNSLSPAHRDVDFYRFDAHKGEIYTFNIDGGMKDMYSTGVATDLAVFGPPYPNETYPHHLYDQSNVGLPIDSPGSVSPYDARIENFTVPESGTYYIAVTSFPATFTDAGNLALATTLYPTSPYAGINGTYQLLITLTKPAIQTINIDIRPGRRDVIIADSVIREYSKRGRHSGRDYSLGPRHELEGLRHRFRHGLPVALLSSDTFDATEVDQSTLKFGATGEENSFIRCGRRTVDVNQDKLPDLVCWFDFTKSDFVPGDNQGILTGSTNAGDAFEGKGWLKIVTGRRNLHDYERLLERHRGHHDHHRR